MRSAVRIQVTVAEIQKIIRSSISRINEEYRQGPSLYFYHKVISLCRTRGMSAFLLSDKCIEILYATLAAWDMNTRAAKMENFQEFRHNLQKNRKLFAEAEKYLPKEPWKTPSGRATALFFLLAINNEMKLMRGDSKIVCNSKCLHFFFPNLCPPIDRGTFTLFFGNINESEDKLIRIVDFSYDVIQTLKSPSRYLDREWNICPMKIVDNAIILKRKKIKRRQIGALNI